MFEEILDTTNNNPDDPDGDVDAGDADLGDDIEDLEKEGSDEDEGSEESDDAEE